MGGGSHSIPSTMSSKAADHELSGIQVSVVVGGASREQVKIEDEDQEPSPRHHDDDDQDIDQEISSSPVVDAHSGVELLSAHDIVPSPNPDSPPPSLDTDHQDDETTETVMIDASDFRGVLNEPTYQTLNGRMTPPGFAPSSSYATLTPLQPLPPISTMSDKFSHYGHHHHAGNGGFAIMQNPVSMANYHQQYDKLGSAMAAAGMNSQGVQLAVNVSIGNLPPGHHVSQQHPTLVMTSNGQIASHGHVIQGNLSSPFHNGMNSPDKSMSPTNGYEYSSRTVQSGNLGSPQSPSSVNLHSPTSLLQTSLNGLPTTPSPAQLPPSPPTSSGQSSQISSGHIIAHTQSVFVTSSPSRETKVVSMSSAPPAHISSHHHHQHSNQVTVLQAVTPSIVPRAQTVTIVQTPVNNLAAAIVSTPVTVVTTANSIHNNNLNNQSNNNNENNTTNARHAKSGNSSSNKNCVTSSSRSESSATSGDELEEINTKELAQRISAELKRYSIPQAIFAQRVLCRSQGTLSDLLRNPKPWSKLKSGRETFRRMSKWLEEPEFQRMSALRLAGQFFFRLNILFQCCLCFSHLFIYLLLLFLDFYFIYQTISLLFLCFILICYHIAFESICVTRLK